MVVAVVDFDKAVAKGEKGCNQGGPDRPASEAAAAVRGRLPQCVDQRVRTVRVPELVEVVLVHDRAAEGVGTGEVDVAILKSLEVAHRCNRRQLHGFVEVVNELHRYTLVFELVDRCEIVITFVSKWRVGHQIAAGKENGWSCRTSLQIRDSAAGFVEMAIAPEQRRPRRRCDDRVPCACDSQASQASSRWESLPSSAAPAAVRRPFPMRLRQPTRSGGWRKRMGIEPTLAEHSPAEQRF